MRILLIFVSICMFLLMAKRYKKMNMLFSPASVFSLIWLLFIFFFLLFDDEKYEYFGILWLFIAIIVLNAGQFLTTFGYGNHYIFSRKNNDFINELRITNSKRFFRIINLSNLLLVICIPLILISIFDYIKSGGINNVAQVAYDYYTGEHGSSSMLVSLWSQIQSFLMYISGFIGGRLFCQSNKKSQKLISFCPFICPIIMMLTSSGKLGVIVVGITFVIGYIVQSLDNGCIFNFQKFLIIIRKMFLIIPIICFLFAFSLSLRQGTFSWDNLLIGFNRLKSYAFGSPAAFNAWFSNREETSLTFGVSTFTGILHALGLAPREQGVYQVAIVTNVWDTNVFTAFRGLILDFGVFFSLIIVFAIGVLSGTAYRSFIIRRRKLSFWILCNSYLFSLYSIIISPFIYLNLSILFALYILFSSIFKNVNFLFIGKSKIRGQIGYYKR